MENYRPELVSDTSRWIVVALKLAAAENPSLPEINRACELNQFIDNIRHTTKPRLRYKGIVGLKRVMVHSDQHALRVNAANGLVRMLGWESNEILRGAVVASLISATAAGHLPTPNREDARLWKGLIERNEGTFGDRPIGLLAHLDRVLHPTQG